MKYKVAGIKARKVNGVPCASANIIYEKGVYNAEVKDIYGRHYVMSPNAHTAEQALKELAKALDKGPRSPRKNSRPKRKRAATRAKNSAEKKSTAKSPKRSGHKARSPAKRHAK